ncbi:MAG: aminotransferase class IV, partial [Ferruginibacter sp.]
MRYINYNGKFYEEGTPIINADSRALRYGDGLFETIKFKNNDFILLQDHLERLWKGLDLLQFEKPKLFTKQFLRDELADLVKKNKDIAARIRLTVFRASGGLYDPEHQHPQFIIESMPLTTNTEILNSNGLQLCIYRDALKSCDSFCNIKHNNFLPYSMGA